MLKRRSFLNNFDYLYPSQCYDLPSTLDIITRNVPKCSIFFFHFYFPHEYALHVAYRNAIFLCSIVTLNFCITRRGDAKISSLV